MPKTLGPYHMSDREEYEVQRTNNFEVRITGVGQDDSLTFAVDSANLPSISTPAIELSYGNAKVKVAGQAEYDDVTIEVKDFIGADVEQIVRGWQRKVHNPDNDHIGMAVNYKKEATLDEYAPDGSHVRSWTLSGVWPNSVEYGDFSYDGGDKKTISMTLSVDKAFREDLSGGA